MLKLSTLSLFLALFLALPASAQHDYRVRFQHGTEFFPENFKQSPPPAAPGESVNGLVYRYVQFHEIPSAEARKSMAAEGVQFFSYVHFGAYLAGFPTNFDWKKLEAHAPRSIVAVNPAWKIAANLHERPLPAHAQVGGKVEVNVQVYPNISIKQAAQLCRENGLQVVFEGTQNGFLTVRFFPDDLEFVAALPFVQYLEIVPPPGEKEDTGGRSLHRSNMVDSDAPMGRKYNGAGVKVLTRDDGVVGPHLDFRGRLFNLTQSRPGQTHGDGVSGIMAGAGNIDPTQKGMAAGADLYVSDYVSNFQDTTLPLHQQGGVNITNSSYSDGCNDGYTLNAQIVDRQLFENPLLMHVFSAGNMGNVDCDYGAGAVWGNITGGHKMAKNAIATANLYADFELEVSSSRGPAHDGRLKPDIAAHGQNQGSTAEDHTYQTFGGTSGAAPGIAGCLAQLTQAFRQIENGEEPPAALLKAVIMNTANDMGNRGPDFKYGWGHINAWRALRLLEEKRWLRTSVANGQAINLQLAVPDGVRQARVMVYWADPQAATNTNHALVHDLDLVVYQGVGGPGDPVFLPWKLDPTPDAAVLNAPAGRGRDSLNNVEQVVLDNPTAGQYALRIAGQEVPFGPQEFYVVWEFLTDEVQITYPAGGEQLVPGEGERIHWDAINTGEPFTLRFAPDGSTWQDVATLAPNQTFHGWTVPNVLTSNAKLAIVRGGKTYEIAAPFHIMRVPQSLQVNKVCPDSMTVTWAKVNDTLHYEVFTPGQKYMEIVGRTAATEFTFPIQNAGAEQFFTVRAVTADGSTVGRRAYALRYPGGLLNCPQPFDVSLAALNEPSAASIISCQPVNRTVRISVKNEGQNTISGATASYQVGNNTPVTEPLPDVPVGTTLEYEFTQPVFLSGSGNLNLRLWTTFTADIVRFNDTLAVVLPVVTEPKTGLHSMNFQNTGFPPLGWRVENPDGQITWASNANIPAGISGNATTAAYFNCFNYTNKGAEDYLYMIPSRLINIAKPGLAFDLAHAAYSNNSRDRLRVEVFPACDLTATPVVVFDKTNPELPTTTNTSTQFIPDKEGEWRTEVVNLEQFAGQTVIIRFAGVNDYGNNIFLDNIRTVNYNLSPAVAAFSFNQDSICRGESVIITNQSTGNFLTHKWLFGAQASPAQADGPGPHEVKYITPGTKNVRLIVINSTGADTLTKQLVVVGQSYANFTTTQNQNAVQFNNISTFSDTYLWDFGDGQTSTEKSPLHTYATTGTFTVKLTTSNQCKVSEKTVQITVSTIGTEELPGGARAQILPNPTDGNFAVEIQSPRSETFHLDLLDGQGRLLHTELAELAGGSVRVNFENLNLPKGIYQLNIKGLRGSRALRVVVQ